MRIFTTLFAVAAVLCLAGAPAGASPNARVGQPDVLVLVLMGLQGGDQANLTYAKTTPHTQVQRDLSQLQSQAGWPMAKIEIRDDVYPATGDKLTSASFYTHGLVAPGSQALPLSQVILALKSYNRVTIAYRLPGDISFRGLRDYNDNNLDIHLEQSGTTFTYHVRILNPNFDRLNLPLYQPEKAVVAQETAHPSRPIRPWQLALLAVLAAGAGVAVYFLTSRRPLAD